VPTKWAKLPGIFCGGRVWPAFHHEWLAFWRRSYAISCGRHYRSHLRVAKGIYASNRNAGRNVSCISAVSHPAPSFFASMHLHSPNCNLSGIFVIYGKRLVLWFRCVVLSHRHQAYDCHPAIASVRFGPQWCAGHAIIGKANSSGEYPL
jgi:hypothetical protein